MSACDEDYPRTDVLYDEISGDALMIVALCIAGVFSVVCLVLFLEAFFFVRRENSGDEWKKQSQCTLLGLYPVISIMALISILVPSSSVILDLVMACYLSACIYIFVSMTIDAFGGEEEMVEALADEQIQLSTPPCFCCCCCILRPRTLTRQLLMVFKTLAMQVAIVRPVVLLLAAVLWTDDKYKADLGGVSAYLFISIISGLSTILSMYSLIVIFRASRQHLQHINYTFRFFALQVTIILVNLQNVVFNALAQRGIPECKGSRSSRMRAKAMNNSLLVIESLFLLLLARRGYRIQEVAPAVDMESKGAGTSNHFNHVDTTDEK